MSVHPLIYLVIFVQCFTALIAFFCIGAFTLFLAVHVANELAWRMRDKWSAWRERCARRAKDESV